MKTGKLPHDVLNKFIFPFLGFKRPEVLVHSKFGEDCSVIDFGEYVAVLSTDPITGAGKDIGRLAVNVSCNDIAANGAEPIGLLITIMFPTDTTEEKIKDVMEQIHAAASDLGVEVLGGHTEITPAVSKTVISSTALGRALKSEFVTSSGAKPGDSVIMTKTAGLEGSAILATDFEEFLKKRIGYAKVKRAQGFIKNISVVPEGKIAAKHGATAMHDVTEGGILGAVYELAKASEVGIKIFSEKIPIAEETIQICKIFDIDPLKLISSGCMIITIPNGEKLISILKDAGIHATIIGEVTAGNEIFLVKNRCEEPVTPPDRDELFSALEKIENLEIK